MFVFKAGVVGAGVMGGEISQVIAAAGIPVVLKDVDTTFVDAGLQKAREVTEGQVAKLVKKGKISEEDATAQADRTLSLITGIGDATNRPDKVVGFHFFWPASYMRLIEVIEGEDTAPETTQAAANFAQAIKKMPVRCHECPGFVVNRILVSTASEIWRDQD